MNKSHCAHIKLLTEDPYEYAVNFQNCGCSYCNVKDDHMWLCLHPKCCFVGCGEKYSDHSSKHAENKQHRLTINLTNQRIWCYNCEKEVFYKNKVHKTKNEIVHSNDNFSSYGTNYYLKQLNLIEESDITDSNNPRGLAGLKNLGNTCYMNSAIQALSNCHPLTRFFIDCPDFIFVNHKGSLAMNYMKLIREMWRKRKPSFVSPNGLLSSMKRLQPMFRGYLQHDSQEFLRYLMDNLHEELKQPVVEPQSDSSFPSIQSPDQGYDTSDSFANSETDPANKDCGDGSHLISSSSNTSIFANDDKSFSSLTLSSEEQNKIKRVEERKEQQISTKFSSIISEIFDGQLLSSVQCMTCKNVSTTKETFQDLSLPIPSSEQLSVIKSSSLKNLSEENNFKRVGWISWIYSLFQAIFWGPTIHLQDCLSSFFSADDLKGDNMYSCEKCKKLRNGIKFSRVLKLPEILCIHLKRFRYDYMFASASSSKISSSVTFPIEELDMRPYLHKECKDHVTKYNLISVICHHGGASGGHYTAYCLNALNETWYQFDDQLVTEVDVQQVEASQAYVLFYQKIEQEMLPLREDINNFLINQNQSLISFFISRKWILRFNTFSEPGPITNYDFLCRHGLVRPNHENEIMDLVIELPPKLWEFFHKKFGGGPAVNHLKSCELCKQEIFAIRKRQKDELAIFYDLTRAFNEGKTDQILALNMKWFRDWESFVKMSTDTPPSKIDNSQICLKRGNQTLLQSNSDYGQVSEDTWNFFVNIYGGGPAIYIQ